MTALLGGATFYYFAGYERNSPAAPSDFDRHMSGHRLTQTALFPLL